MRAITVAALIVGADSAALLTAWWLNDADVMFYSCLVMVVVSAITILLLLRHAESEDVAPE